MACKKCKQKNDGSLGQSKQDLLNSVEGITKFVRVVIVIWTVLAMYGLYSLIRDFL
jgi:hypothetical protein